MHFQMEITMRLLILIFTFCLVGCQVFHGGPEMQAVSLTPGLHELEFPLEQREILRYALSVPDLQPGSKVPLVLALHYGGESRPYFGKAYLEELVEPAFRDLGAIIVAPDCPGNGWTDLRSEMAVLALLDYAVNVWPIDPKRVVITGFSMGGVGTWYIAGRHPDRFSAVVPVAGRPVGELDESLPVYVVHSRKDEVFDLELTEHAVRELREKGGTVELVVVDGLIHYQIAQYAQPLSGVVEWLTRVWESER